MDKNVSQWLPLFVSFIAGGFALQQIRSNNITNARIKWLENLKQVLTDFISECTILQLKVGLTNGIDEGGGSFEIPETTRLYYNKLNESLIEHLKLVEAKHSLILLNLNPKENLHLKFEGLLNDYIDLFNAMPIEKNLQMYNSLVRKMGAYSDTIILLIRYIMKLEWEKTKRSYFSKSYYMKYGKGKKLLQEALRLELLPERPPSVHAV